MTRIETGAHLLHVPPGRLGWPDLAVLRLFPEEPVPNERSLLIRIEVRICFGIVLERSASSDAKNVEVYNGRVIIDDGPQCGLSVLNLDGQWFDQSTVQMLTLNMIERVLENSMVTHR